MGRLGLGLVASASLGGFESHALYLVGYAISPHGAASLGMGVTARPWPSTSMA